MVGGGRSSITRLRWRVGAQYSSCGSGTMRMVGRPVWGGADAASAAAATAKVVEMRCACGGGGSARWMSTEVKEATEVKEPTELTVKVLTRRIQRAQRQMTKWLRIKEGWRARKGMTEFEVSGDSTARDRGNAWSPSSTADVSEGGWKPPKASSQKAWRARQRRYRRLRKRREWRARKGMTESEVNGDSASRDRDNAGPPSSTADVSYGGWRKQKERRARKWKTGYKVSGDSAAQYRDNAGSLWKRSEESVVRVGEWLPRNLGLEDNLKAPGRTSDLLASAREILKDIIVSQKDSKTAAMGAQPGWIYKFLVAARRSEEEAKKSEGWVAKFQEAVRQAELKQKAIKRDGGPKRTLETIAIENAQAMLKPEDFEAAEIETVKKSTPLVEVLVQEEGKAEFTPATAEELFREVHAPQVYAETVSDSTYERERLALLTRTKETMHSQYGLPGFSHLQWPSHERRSIPSQDESGAHVLRAVENKTVETELKQKAMKKNGRPIKSLETIAIESEQAIFKRKDFEAAENTTVETDLEREAMEQDDCPTKSMETIAIESAHAMLKQEDFEAAEDKTVEKPTPLAVNRLADEVLAQEEEEAEFPATTPEEPSREVYEPGVSAETVSGSPYVRARQAWLARTEEEMDSLRGVHEPGLSLRGVHEPRVSLRGVHEPWVSAETVGDFTSERERQSLREVHVPRLSAETVGDSTFERERQSLREVHKPLVSAETVGDFTYERERQAWQARINMRTHSRNRDPRRLLPQWPPRERRPKSPQDESGARALRIYDDGGELDIGELGAEYSKLGEDAVPEAAVVVQASPAKEMKIVPAPGDDVTVPPTLAHGLDRVLFSPGVHMLQDPRTGVYNFPADLKNIMSVHDFDFDALPQYQPPSVDNVLEKVAVKYKRRYYGSTSNMTVILSQFHFFLSRSRPLHVPQLSKAFQVRPEFTKGSLAAASFFLRYKPKTGTYALDVDKSGDEDMILMWLGRSMEKQLVTNSTEYSLFHRENSHQLTPEMRADRETYHYTAFGDFMMRSQQDAMDARLPGEGTFDLKTRAVEAVRYDIDYINERATCDYQLRTLKGERESFEREYYDMARSSFLKYLLQVRMGRMDGIMVAYHNVKRLFGFQYIPREEMDAIIHGPSYRNVALPEFQVSIEMLGDLFGRATEKFPETSLHGMMHYEEHDQELHVFVTPMSEEEIAKTQKIEASRMFKVKKKAQKIAKAILTSDETDANAQETTEEKKYADDQFYSTLDEDINYTTPELKDKHEKQAFAHYRIEVNHLVNGLRLPPSTPPVIEDGDDWKIEYSISEIPEHGDRESVVEFSRAMETRKFGRAGANANTLRWLSEAGARYQDLLDARDREQNFETYTPERGEVLYQERIEKMREEMKRRMESGEEPTLEQLKGYKEVTGFWEMPSPRG